MIRAYCGVPQECTEEQAQKFSPLLEKIGIKIVFMHNECCLSTTLEKSAEEIDILEVRHPTGSNCPLQPNCLYSYMPLEGTPNPIRHPVIKLLEEKPKKLQSAKAIPITVFINCSLPQEKDYVDLPASISVYKDIIFLDEITRKEVGWYNRIANIVWFSDIFHFLENTATQLPVVVNSIIEYKRYGRVQEVLTVGADPEFEIIDENEEFVEANRLFGDMNNEIGFDGHAATGEFRPKPDRSPLGLTRNIKRLVRRLNSMQCMGGSKVWVGGGVHVTTGGHIHFGMKGLNKEVQDMLYDLVAEPVLAFQSSMRKKNEVGNWQRESGGTLRDQPHGCEWRPLPSFIVNEAITSAVLCTAYAIVKSWKFHKYTRKSAPATKEDFYKIPLYGAYKTQIDEFIHYFITKEEKIALYKKDIFAAWDVKRIQKDFTVSIFTQSEWLSNYFTPVNAKLKRSVKLEIRFNGDMISTFGISKEYLEELVTFSNDHYLPHMVINEKLPKGQNRYLICLPTMWYHMTGKTKFCEDFKNILKNIILKLGGK